LTQIVHLYLSLPHNKAKFDPYRVPGAGEGPGKHGAAGALEFPALQKPGREGFRENIIARCRVSGAGKESRKTYGILCRSVSDALTLMRQSLSIAEADSTCVFLAISLPRMDRCGAG
jgi:hypothetical protein